jgi:hypothetical protein
LNFDDFSVEKPSTQRGIVSMLTAWYDKEKGLTEEQTFYDIGKEILGAHLQCPTTKLNQIVLCKYNV